MNTETFNGVRQTSGPFTPEQVAQEALKAAQDPDMKTVTFTRENPEQGFMQSYNRHDTRAQAAKIKKQDAKRRAGTGGGPKKKKKRK